MDEENTFAPVTPEQPKNNSLIIPLAILVGFGMIAAAIFFKGDAGSIVKVGNLTETESETQETETGPIRPIDENDHVRGNPNAPILIVEYSDFDCPFCKNFHETMNLVMDNYGSTGQVAWVYRHFPIQQLHPNAPYVAAASECVAKLAGNDAFWTFSDLAFGERTTNEPTNTARLTEFAVTAGADATAFEACLENGDTVADVEADYEDAIKSGGRGTPHSVITVAGQQGVINGAQPYSNVSQIIDNLLTQIAGEEVDLEATE